MLGRVVESVLIHNIKWRRGSRTPEDKQRRDFVLSCGEIEADSVSLRKGKREDRHQDT